MRRFATVATSDSLFKVTLWEEADDKSCKAVGHFSDVRELDEDIEVWRFNVETSLDLDPRDPALKYPVLDADGGPLWPGCAVEFVRQSYYVNTDNGSGYLVGLEGCGQARIACDQAMPVRGRNGEVLDMRDEIVFPVAQYQYDGRLKGTIMLKGLLGDPYERGQTEVYVRRTSDPRKVCTLLEPELAPSPQMA